MTEKKTNPKFTIEIDCLGKTWTKGGRTILEALEKFDMDWSEVKSAGEITVTGQGKEFKRRFNAVQLRRILNNKIIKAHWSKNFDLLLK